MYVKHVLVSVLVLLLAGCGSQSAQQSASASDYRASLDAAYRSAEQRCKAEADRTPERWRSTYFECDREEVTAIALEYGDDNLDLVKFSSDYRVALARRYDAGIITDNEFMENLRRINRAEEAERRRRLDAKIQAWEADRRAASLAAIASGLGATVRAEPPPPQTTLYNFSGTHVTCTRWENIVNCY